MIDGYRNGHQKGINPIPMASSYKGCLSLVHTSEIPLQFTACLGHSINNYWYEWSEYLFSQVGFGHL